MSPLISIIINCRNGEKFLKFTLESVLNQTYQNYEVIFWDNNSTDSSKKIFDYYKDSRFKYYKSDKNLNLYDARNLACQKSKGQFISFIDTDDVWYPNFLKSRINFFNNKEFYFSYCNCHHFYEASNKKTSFLNFPLPTGNIFKFLTKKYIIKISCLIIRKDILINEGLFNPNYNIIGDYDLVMRLAKKYKAHAVQNEMAMIRYHNKNFLDLNRKMFFEEYYDWYKNQKLPLNIKKNVLLFLVKLFLIRLLPRLVVNLIKKK